MVNVNHVYDIREGLQEAGVHLDEELIESMTSGRRRTPSIPESAGARRDGPRMRCPNRRALSALAKTNDVAVVVIARTAGEDRDNTAGEGFLLSYGRRGEAPRSVCKAFTKTVVLLNVGNIIDMSWVDKYDPAAVMYVWQAGMYGGLAVGDLIAGKASSSGCLTDTIAYDLEDYPSGRNFGQGDVLRTSTTRTSCRLQIFLDLCSR